MSKGGANIKAFVLEPYYLRINPFTISEDKNISKVLCVSGLALGRAELCGVGGGVVINGIRADPRRCTYELVSEHTAHGACVPG